METTPEEDTKQTRLEETLERRAKEQREREAPARIVDELTNTNTAHHNVVVGLSNAHAALGFTVPDPSAPGALLDEAREIVTGARADSYGPPDENHGCTAALWSDYIERRFRVTDIQLTARDVCWMNILQKASRDAHRPERDNLRDTAGFAENAARCGEGDES